MANQTTKKELLEESLHHHHPEGNEEEVDKEWEEFTRLMAKLKENRRNRPHRPSQAFYPCPLPTPEEEQQDFDPFDYINTIIGQWLKFGIRMMNYDWSRRFSTVHKATSGTMVKVARPLNDRQVNEAAFEINVPRDIRMLSRDSILDAPRDSRETILVDDTFGLQARIAQPSDISNVLITKTIDRLKKRKEKKDVRFIDEKYQAKVGKLEKISSSAFMPAVLLNRAYFVCNDDYIVSVSLLLTLRNFILI
uniref:Uncharacterized protein n=1 Tax=Vespula pensylvanica TaxID=30213 RepID=A0A834PEE4_VESPE|nr:hypothetical protein H0235_000490 [Vespula pensylvanica]